MSWSPWTNSFFVFPLIIADAIALTVRRFFPRFFPRVEKDTGARLMGAIAPPK